MPPSITPYEKIEKVLLEKNITLVNPLDYKGISHRYLFKCMKCNHVWLSLLTSIYSQGRGCRSCYFKRRESSKKEVRRRLAKKNIKLIERYDSRSAKVKCKICKHVWVARINAAGCEKCQHSNHKVSLKSFKEKLKRKHPSVSFSGDFQGSMIVYSGRS